MAELIHDVILEAGLASVTEHLEECSGCSRKLTDELVALWQDSGGEGGER